MNKFLIVSLTAVRMFGADAAMFRGDAAHSGVYSSTAPGITTVKWTAKTGGKIISSPVVAGGVVYVGSSDRRLYAVNATDGSVKWKFPSGGAMNSSPAVSNNTVYISSLDGNFYAVDAESGKQKWKFATAGESRFTAPGIHGAIPKTERMPDPFDMIMSSPVISGGIVYFGSGDHNVYALDASSGELKWKFGTGDVVHATPAVADGVVYIGSWDRYLYALDAANGRQIWKFETGNDTEIYNQIGIASSAAVAGGVVFFGCRDGHFYAVDAKTGKQKWSHDNHGGWVIASPAVRDGVVYFPTSDGTRFKAIEAASGKLLFDLGNKEVSFSSPALAGDVAYFGTSDGWVHAVNVKTQKSVGEFQTEGNKANAAKYIGPDGKLKGVYTEGTLDGLMVGMERMYTLGSVISSPVVVGGVVYVGSTDGNLYALTGQLL